MQKKGQKKGVLDAKAEARIAEILSLIEQDPRYIVEKGDMKSGDLSRVVGRYFDIRLRKGKGVIRARTHYEGKQTRIAVIYRAYQRRLNGYDHRMEALDLFLKDEEYERVMNVLKKEDERAEKSG